MSQTSQLYTLVPNVANVISVIGQANRVKVFNDSAMYLRVYFGADAPRLATDPGWHETVSPGDRPLLWVTGGTGQSWWAQGSYSAATPFRGVVTILPFFPVGASVASGGVISGISIAYLTAYAPDENAESGATVEAFIQAAKQGRYQSTMGAQVGAIARQSTPITQATVTPVLLHTIDSINSVAAPNLFTANAAGVSFVNVYLYWLNAKLRSRGPAAATAHFFLSLVLTDNTGVTVRNRQQLNVEPWLYATNFGRDEFVYAPTRPLLVTFNIAQNTLVSGDLISLELFGYPAVGVDPAPNNGTWEALFTAHATTDFVNQTPLTELPSRRAAAAIPWATYNPQTY